MVGEQSNSRGSVMSNVLNLQFARKRARQSESNFEATELEGGSVSNQTLLRRLEAENAQLRGSVVELALQVQALRHAARTLTA